LAGPYPWEAVELLVQQLPHPAKDHIALLQERDDLTPKELHDRPRYDFQRQRVALVHLDQAYPVVRETHHLFLRQELDRKSVV